MYKDNRKKDFCMMIFNYLAGCLWWILSSLRAREGGEEKEERWRGEGEPAREPAPFPLINELSNFDQSTQTIC
jgi:hypothetical protein